MKAIAAMSLNRVIGRDNSIPWRLAEDFRWFKRATMGQSVVMGRKTFESLGKPLSGRKNCVLTRSSRDSVQCAMPLPPDTELIVARELSELDEKGLLAESWLAGGASLYEQFLPRCSDLYLSVVNRKVEGDAFFPEFEHLFGPDYEVELKTEDFEVRHYRRRQETTA